MMKYAAPFLILCLGALAGCTQQPDSGNALVHQPAAHTNPPMGDKLTLKAFNDSVSIGVVLEGSNLVVHATPSNTVLELPYDQDLVCAYRLKSDEVWTPWPSGLTLGHHLPGRDPSEWYPKPTISFPKVLKTPMEEFNYGPEYIKKVVPKEFCVVLVQKGWKEDQPKILWQSNIVKIDNKHNKNLERTRKTAPLK